MWGAVGLAVFRRATIGFQAVLCYRFWLRFCDFMDTLESSIELISEISSIFVRLVQSSYGREERRWPRTC